MIRPAFLHNHIPYNQHHSVDFVSSWWSDEKETVKSVYGGHINASVFNFEELVGVWDYRFHQVDCLPFCFTNYAQMIIVYTQQKLYGIGQTEWN